MSRKKIVSDTLFFAFADGFGQILGILRGFVVAKLLAPNLYGYFGGLSLIQFYSAQGHLGILHGMNRELSLTRGANDYEGYENVKNSSFTSIFLLATLISVGIIIFTIIARDKYSDYLIWGMRIFGLAVILQHLEMVYHSILRAESRMKVISSSKLLFAFLNFSLAVIFIQFWGFYGVLASILVTRIIANIYLLIKAKFSFSLQIDRSLIASLIKTGLPISFMFLVEVILTSVDRVMIIRYLDSTRLGYYSIALTLCEALSRLPNAIIYTYFPKILEKYGETGEISSLREHFEVPSLILSLCVGLFAGIAFMLIGILILNFLPAYKEAITASQILLFSAFFMALTQMGTRVLITINKNRMIIVFQIVVIFVSIALHLLFLKMGYGIKGVAIATTVAYLMYGIAVMSHTLSLFYKSKWVIIIKQLIIYIPILFCVISLFIINKLFLLQISTPSGFFIDLYHVLLPMFAFIFFFSVMSYLLMLQYQHLLPVPTIKSLLKRI